MDVFVVYCPSLILIDAVSVPAIAEYCSKEHHVFEIADGIHDV
jgi:hypothetical protein